MPNTPRTARRRSYSRRDGSKSKDIPPKIRPQSLYEPTSVQDRIRQWQSQGAADAASPDALSVRSIPLSDHSIETPRARMPERKAPNIEQSWRQRFLEKERELRNEEKATRDVNAPKKRVISDEHWKSKKNEKTRTSLRAATKTNIRTPHHDLSYTSTGRPSRRWKGNPDTEPLARASAAVDDLNTYIDQELARRLEGHEIAEDDSDQFSDPFSLVAEDWEFPVSRSKYAESLGQHRALDTTKVKPKGAKILTKTKEIFSSAEEPHVVANRIPSIEAWLEEQPDPFVEATPKEPVPAVEVPEPLRRRSRRTKRRTSGRATADPNKIWDSVTINEEDGDAGDTRNDPPSNLDRSGSGDANRTRSGQQRESPEASPTGLKRRGARAQRNSYAPQGRLPIGESPRSSHLPLRPASANEESMQRACPPTGAHRLEIIASVETFKENHEPPPYEEHVSAEPCGLKRKLTTHEDLMSVLSLPMERKGSRTRRKTPASCSQPAPKVPEVLVAEEERYNRELRTLVDGVIPVLVQCVLSKSTSVAAAGLFTSSTSVNDDMAFTKPIIDMGIALERLKSLHGRIPLYDVDALLAWGKSAKKAYSDYLNAWRLGFHDVVVNLAPLDEDQENIDCGMLKDADGDVVNAEGKKVDVAYLLKRPLVRVKNLSKTFACIEKQTGKQLAVEASQIFGDLTATARRRHQEEQARLEDEAAANIDSTRARNVRTLGPSPNVVLDRTRKVRARDCFNLTMYHSTGQRMDCRIEMIFRDNNATQGNGGDVLICEIDQCGRWLLFAPVNISSISARRGEDSFDLVVMIRGLSGISQEWHELLALKSEDPDATAEWMSMLGSHPLPPKLNRTRSFKDGPTVATSSSPASPSQTDTPTSLGMPNEVDIPIGEPSILGKSDRPSPNQSHQKALLQRFIPRLNLGGGLHTKQNHMRPGGDRPSPKTAAASVCSSDRSTVSDLSLKELPRVPKALSSPATPSHASPRPSQNHGPLKVSGSFIMSGGLSPLDSEEPVAQDTPATKSQYLIQEKTTQQSAPESGKPPKQASRSTSSLPQTTTSIERPVHHRAVSSTPTQDLPTITKLRSQPGQRQPTNGTPLNDSMRDQWNALTANADSSQRRRRQVRATKSEIFTEDIPSPPAHTLGREPPPQSTLLRPTQTGPAHSQLQHTPPPPPPPPPHRDLSSITTNSSHVSVAEPQLKLSPKPESARKRRSSSPLKREYAPSTASDSSPDSDSDDISDSSSDTSQDFMSEVQDMHTPLVAVTAGNRRNSKIGAQHLVSAPTTGTRTLAPSDSASQGPYRKVPSSSSVPSSKTSKTIALVCAWSEKGSWEQIHPDECSIVISPGIIEAFEMSAAHSGGFAVMRDEVSDEGDLKASSMMQQPLVAFDLTPIVPLRRGTALDISIRSPSTANSKVKTTSNIMFRSRNAEECDALYGMINWARCNNPTYIQLQNTRPREPPVTFNTGQPESNRPRAGSWFGFGGRDRKSSYRASSAPGNMSIGGDSEASVGTMSTAISALKRLGVSSAFNLNRSSVIRKSGLSRTSGSLYSSSTGTRAGSGSSTPAASQLGFVPGKDGPNAPATSADAVGGAGMVNNMKIRLYVRKGQHWDNLGAGRLSILPAASPPPEHEKSNERGSEPGTGQSTPTRQPSMGVVGHPNSRGPRLSSSNHTPHRIHGNGREKRLVIRKNKDSEVILLDEVLGESCFERVMQTGIAVKVWSEDEEIGDRGGVVMGRERIYMMQFPGTRDAGWVFSLCGSYRYGID